MRGGDHRTPASPTDPGVTQTVEMPIYLLTVGQLRQLRTLVGVLVVVIFVLVVVIGMALPRALAYGPVFEENLVMRARVAEIDRRMAEVDRVMLRLRLYDAQIKGLGGVSGDHGPLPDVRASDPEGGDFEPPADDVDPYAPGEGGVHGPHHMSLRPADVWAGIVQARIETFLAVVGLAEPDLNAVVRELEDIRALDQALPRLWPSDGPMTSRFGWRRSPFGRTWRFHSGLDIGSRRGDPIVAVGPGRVIKAEFNAGYGRMVEIDHGFGISTLYAHATTLEVRQGDRVEAGRRIATVGSTGRSTGPHLHFEVRLDGHPVDPLDYLPR